MKKFAMTLVAALAWGLAACSGGEEAPPPVVEETATEAPALTAADGGPAAGTFEVTSADGVVLTQVLSDDGTQTTTGADGISTPGKWTMDSPDKYCRMDGEETEWTCYAEAVAEDGTWTATNMADDKEVWTIVRKE